MSSNMFSVCCLSHCLVSTSSFVNIAFCVLFAHIRARQTRGQTADRDCREGQSAVTVTAQVRVQRRGEVRLARHAFRACQSDRRGDQLQRCEPAQSITHDDERSGMPLHVIISPLLISSSIHSSNVFFFLSFLVLWLFPLLDFSVCQLRCPENDWCRRAVATQAAHAQNPTTRLDATQVHVWQTYFGQIGKVFSQKQCGLGAYWSAIERSHLITRKFCN